MIPSSDYPINVEDGTETARLADQDRLITQSMGGLFPELSKQELISIRQVLDLACGPAGWTCDVAFSYPAMSVVGVDKNEIMVNYAMAQAKVQRIENITFEVMDITQPLELSDATFDLVNARLLSGFVSPNQWPILLGECLRVLKPGGILRLTEMEGGISNSRALQRLSEYLYTAFRQQERCFSVDGHSLGIVPMQAKLLRQAGFTSIQQRPFHLDSSYDAPSHLASLHNTQIVFAELKPYLVDARVVSSDVFDELFNTMLIEMYQEHFVCTTFGLTTWGRKPDRPKGATQP